MKRKSLAPLVTATILGMLALLSCTTPEKKEPAAGQTQIIRILHIADTHSQLDTHWEYLPEDPEHLHRMGGYARLKTALTDLENSAPGPVFLADGGDTFQGSAISAWTKGEAVVGPLNALNLDVGIPGNWEVVYGPEALKKLSSEVNYKYIAYNFEDTNTGKNLFPAYAIIEKQGVRVAFFGITDPTTSERQPPAEVKGLDTTHMDGLRKLIQEVKEKEHPNLVVLVSHQGLAPSVKLAEDIPELDILLSGHTHERTYKQFKVGHTVIVEPGSMGSFISQLDVKLQNGSLVDSHFELVKVDAQKYAEDPTVAEIIRNSEKPFRKKLDQRVGSTKTTLLRYDVLESTMDNLISDAVREATHADLGFTNGFRFSPPIAPGPITEADLWSALPLDAQVKVGSVTGKQLWDYLENELELVFAKNPYALSGGWGPRPSGMQMVFKAKASKGSRLGKVLIAGQPIDPKKTYSLSGCERDGEHMDIICRLKGVKNARYANITVHQAIIKYIKKHSPLALVKERRAIATDLPDHVWSQYGMLQKMWDLPGDASAMAIPTKGSEEK